MFYFIVIELSCSVLTHLTVYRTQDRCGGLAWRTLTEKLIPKDFLKINTDQQNQSNHIYN